MCAFPQDVVCLAQDLVRYHSISPAQNDVYTPIVKFLEPLKFNTTLLTFEDVKHKASNLFATIGAGTPHLLLSGHLDVVPPGDHNLWNSDPFSAKFEKDILYGRGINDMKGAVAAMLVAVAEFLKKHQHVFQGTLSLMLTGDEEISSTLGTQKLLEWSLKNDYRFDHCLVGEPTCVNSLGDTIKIGRRGSQSFTIELKGTQGHVAYPTQFSNPAEHLVRILSMLKEQITDEGDSNFDPTHMTLTSLDSPYIASNVTPATAKATLNVRFNVHWSKHRLQQSIQDTVNEYCATQKGLTFTLTFDSQASEAFISLEHRLEHVLKQAVYSCTKTYPRRSTSGGTSDARFIVKHCPVVEFGLLSETIHKVNECAKVSDLLRLTEIYERVLHLYYLPS